MYCKYCGSKLKDDADVCLKCGKFIKEEINPVSKKVKIPGKGLSIAGMILGIFAILLMMGEFDSISDFEAELPFVYTNTQFALFIFNYLFMDFLFICTGLALSIVGFTKNKNGFNISGMILNGISLFLLFVLFLLLAGTY